MLKKLLRKKSGQAVSEYTIIIAIVVIAGIAILYAFRSEINNAMVKITQKLRGSVEESVQYK